MNKLFKSKTINFNLLVPAVIGILSAFGVAVPVEVATGVLALGNFILRFATKEAIADK